MDKKILNYLPNNFIEESYNSSIIEEDISHILSLIEEVVSRTVVKLQMKKKLAIRKKRQIAQKKGKSLIVLDRELRRKGRRYRKRNKAKMNRTALKYSRTAAGKRAALIAQRRGPILIKK